MSLPSRRDPVPEARESPEGESVELSGTDPLDALDPAASNEAIDAFCAELLAALTELGRRPTAGNYRSRARLN